MIENVRRAFFKSKMRKPLAVLLSVAMIFTMFPMTAMAAASDTVKIQITDSAGKTATLATWTYDSARETYTDNATGQELAIVKDLISEADLKGTANGQEYDFSDIGALAYTGSNMNPNDCRAIAVATKGILLDDVYSYAGELLDKNSGADVLRSDDVKMKVASSDSDSSHGGASNEYTYSEYWGAVKYYYPAWYDDTSTSEGSSEGIGNGGIVSEADQQDGRVVPTVLAIKGYHEKAADDPAAKAAEKIKALIGKSDTENALRMLIGQKQGGADFNADANLGFNSIHNIKLIKFTLDKTFSDAGLNDVTVDPDGPDKPVGPDPVDPGTDDYDWESLTWAGGLDFSWYDENDVKSEYHITTPAQWESIAWICSEDLGKLADFKTNTNSNVTAIKGTVPSVQNEFAGVQFYLDNDIDMGGVKAADGTWSGPNYYPIGSEGRNDLDDGYFYGVFCGSVNGQGHIVKNVYCERNSGQDTGHGSSSCIGLFGRVGSPDKTEFTDNNITIENIAVSGYIRGYRSTGGVIGKTLHVASEKSLTVRNCLNFAEIVTNGGGKGTGGVIGSAWNSAVVEKCANFGNVTAGYDSANAAGVSGGNESELSDSYNVGIVSNTAKAENVGAVVCNNNNANINITNCYALEGSTPGYTESIVNSKTLISGGWKTASEMKTAEFAKLLSGSSENAWRLIGNGYAAVSSYVAELAGEYPVPAPFVKETSTPVEPGGGGSGGGGGSAGGGGSTGPDTSGLDLKSRSWDGKTVDVSWYFDNRSDSSYTISTAAELAGAAALVNGLVNSDCVVYTGSEVITAKNWNNSSKYVNTDTRKSGDNNQATDTYHYGIESFKGKTLYLSANLDMSGGNYMPVGGQYLMEKNDTKTKIGASFCGMLDGGGHTVNIECDRHCTKNFGDGESIGLIGRLGVHDDDSSSLRPSGAGVCDVAVTGSVRGNRSVGGVVGKIGQTSGTAVIERCVNKADITGTDKKGTGGICGAAWNDGIIRNCYNTGRIVNTNSSYGGIAGSAEIQLINCYNAGKVSGNGKSAAVATSNGGDSYENCYWLKGSADMGVYNKPSVSGVTEMSDADMKTEAFVSKLGSAFAYRSGEYPVLKWEGGSSAGGAAGGGAVTDPTQPTTPQDPATASGYSDVASGAWYSDAVKYVTDKNLMNGTGSGKFSPNASTTRGMIMTILARMSGTDTMGSSPWYKKGLDWAVSKNISDGTKPEATMTREQLATMLYRYSNMMGYDTTQGGMAVREYDDFGKISSYAAEAMTWAVNNQIITGVTKTELQPQGSATRAQIATILMRWSKLNEKAQ